MSAIDAKAFIAASKRVQEILGCSREDADMVVANKFWNGELDENMQPTEGEPISRRPSDAARP